jgi:murein DD-endopeptidase MepM/ murein hydrolase activator NlpD
MTDRSHLAAPRRSGCIVPALIVPALIALGLAAVIATASGSPPATAAPRVAGTHWAWPLRPGPDAVVRGFDPPAQPWLAGHRGVDLAGRAGEPVHPAGAGIVSFAGTIAGMGVVSVRSGPLRTTYEPLHVRVRIGVAVTVRSVLGTLSVVGSHCAPSACLHWGLVRDPDYLDPLALLGLEQVRLLPWVGSG